MSEFSVKNDILYEDGKKVTTVSTKKTSGTFKPGNLRFVVIHYTAGVNFDADVKTLSTADVQASCQLVVSPEGKVTQVGTFRDILWHAGRSSWRGLSGLNSYSIGIENTNPGWVELAYEKEGVKYFKFPLNGKVYWNDKDDEIVQAAHPNGGPVRYWVRFTKAQLDANEGIIRALMKAYPTIQEVVGHDQIAPDRKIDPGPCLPDGFYSLFNKNSSTSTSSKTLIVSGTGGSGLNVRSGPGTNFPRVVLLPEGSQVTELERQNLWVKIKTGSSTGFAHRDYLKTA